MQDNYLEQTLTEATDNDSVKAVEQPTLPSDNESVNEESKVSYGRFKSAESLYEAYKQLEKEFTRKSQELKEYKRANNPEQLLEDLIAVNPNLEIYAEELKKSFVDGTNYSIKLAECLAGKINEPCHIIKDEGFLNEYVYGNKEVTDRIIGDYIESLSESRSPATIKGRGYAYVSPSYRPQTLEEASRLAKKYIENRRI